VTKGSIMSGEEERLYARAEMLEDLDEPVSAVSRVLAGAQGAGVDPRAVISLTAALQTLDPGAITDYTADSKKDRRDGSGYSSAASSSRHCRMPSIRSASSRTSRSGLP
jgi:hypothetical protein